MKKRNKLDNRYIYLILFIISALCLLFPIFFKFNYGFFKSFGLIGITLINFLASATIFLPAPGFLAIGWGGSIYNPILVAFLSALGSSLGEIIGFTFGYSSKKITKKKHKVFDWINKIFHHKYSPALIVFFAFIPNPFFDAIGIVAGASLYSLRKFLLLIFIGRFLRDLLIAYLGNRFL